MPKAMPMEEKIKACLERHPDWPDQRIQNAIRGSTMTAVRAIRAGQPLPESGPPPRAAALRPLMSLIAVDDIKRKYDMFGAIMDIIRSLPAGHVISEQDLKQSIEHPDPFRFKRTIEAREKELEPYRIMLKYKGSEAKYHYARPDVIADLRRTMETP